MTQVNNSGFNNINGVNNNTPSGQQSGQVQKIIAQGSGQVGGISPNVGQAFIGLNQDTALGNALANADASPTRAGLSKLALSVIFGPQAAEAAHVLLPQRATDSDRSVLAGALTRLAHETS
jgi:hypothetical protein